MIITLIIIWLVWMAIISWANHAEYQLALQTMDKPKANHQYHQGLIHGWLSGTAMMLVLVAAMWAIHLVFHGQLMLI